MTFDWNWFFAAYAQCGAALIGIIAAFIISKLLGESDKYEALNQLLESLITKKDDLKKKVSNRHFDWHDRLSIAYSYELKEAIEKGDFRDLTEKQRLEKLFSIDPSLFRVDSCIDYLDKLIQENTPQYIDAGLGMKFKQLSVPKIPPNGLWDKISDEREKINLLKLECENIINKLGKARKQLATTKSNLKPIKKTIYILSIGFFFSVIYPLHFLPLGINKLPSIGFSRDILFLNLFSIRGLLLFLLTLTIESIFVYFLTMTFGLERKYSNTISSVAEKWLDVGYFSKYYY